MADVLAAWVAELAGTLGVDPADLDRDLVLDLARESAHQVARPAAPLTTFLVGYAAGLRGGGRDAVTEVAAAAQRLAAAREPQQTDDSPA
jgi:hypothetical protein